MRSDAARIVLKPRVPQVDRVLVQNMLSPNRHATGNRTVAIVVNTYNQARFLAEALRSCLEQTVPAVRNISCG